MARKKLQKILLRKLVISIAPLRTVVNVLVMGWPRICLCVCVEYVSGLSLTTVLVQKNVVHFFQVSADISGFYVSNILYILNLFCHP